MISVLYLIPDIRPTRIVYSNIQCNQNEPICYITLNPGEKYFFAMICFEFVLAI